MIRIFAQWAAKKYYLFNQEYQAAIADLHAGLSLKLAAEKRALIETLNREADEIEANIKAVDEKLAAGYWECENGHEYQACKHGPMPDNYKECDECAKKPGSPVLCADCLERRSPSLCCECGKPAAFIKRDLMSGQEKYESDKERKEAEDIVKSKRAQAKAEEENVKGSEQTVKYFKDQAKNNRTIAEKVRSL